jgi:hypothetical protein
MGLLSILASIVSVLTSAVVLASRAVSRWWRSSRIRFLSDREKYETQRPMLNSMAIQWYGADAKVIEGTAQITCPGWIPDEPIPISNVTVIDDTCAHSEAALLELLASPLSRYLPYQVDTHRRFPTRHDAVSTLCRPALWENRICYRITQLEICRGSAQLSVAPVHFFTGFDVSETLAIELLRKKGDRPHPKLPLRQAIGQPCGLRLNPVHAGVCTLTIVRGVDGVDRFFLHDRNRTAVADGIGQRHVVPAGVFQPSTDHPGAWLEDQEIWKNIVREACEEFLPDLDPIDSSSAPVDIETVKPYATVMHQLCKGNIRCYFLGMGVDPVQLQPEILTSCIFDEGTFRRLFGATFEQANVKNREGDIIGARVVGTTKSGCRLIGFEFNKSGIEEAQGVPLVSGAAACLSLAWEARSFLVP